MRFVFHPNCCPPRNLCAMQHPHHFLFEALKSYFYSIATNYAHLLLTLRSLLMAYFFRGIIIKRCENRLKPLYAVSFSIRCFRSCFFGLHLLFFGCFNQFCLKSDKHKQHNCFAESARVCNPICVQWQCWCWCCKSNSFFFFSDTFCTSKVHVMRSEKTVPRTNITYERNNNESLFV